MKANISKHLNSRQIQAINRIGDCLIPGEGESPSFSEARCANHVDRLLDFMPSPDLSDLKMLLTPMSFLPYFFLNFIFHFLEFLWAKQLPMGGPLRMIRIGMRGLIMSLYYGTEIPLEKLEYHVSVERS